MFKPNRVGTPHILNSTVVQSSLNWTPEVSSIVDYYRGNVINPTPLADFGQTNLRWSGTEAIGANLRIALVQQFTITAPLNGDAVGVELGGGLSIRIPNGSPVFYVLYKQTNSPASLLASSFGNNTYSALINAWDVPEPNDNTVKPKSYAFKGQAVIQGDVAGSYAHGFAIVDSGAGFNLTEFNIQLFLRQLNDQQAVGYRDTRR